MRGELSHFQERKRPGQVSEVWLSHQAGQPSKRSTGEFGVSAAGRLPFSCRRRVSHGGEDTRPDPHPRRALCREGMSVPPSVRGGCCPATCWRCRVPLPSPSCGAQTREEAERDEALEPRVRRDTECQDPWEARVTLGQCTRLARVR